MLERKHTRTSVICDTVQKVKARVANKTAEYFSALTWILLQWLLGYGHH